MQKDIDIVWTVLERRLRQRYLEHNKKLHSSQKLKYIFLS
jgi:hypothetical protein